MIWTEQAPRVEDSTFSSPARNRLAHGSTGGRSVLKAIQPLSEGFDESAAWPKGRQFMLARRAFRRHMLRTEQRSFSNETGMARARCGNETMHLLGFDMLYLSKARS